MEENKTGKTPNPFFSRGCCEYPNLYNDNSCIFKHSCSKLDSYNWLKDIVLPENQKNFDCVEVRFKNSRKDFYRISPDMKLNIGDIVAVEVSPGHDIGIISMIGESVRINMKKKNIDYKSEQIKKVYRRARLSDIEKWITSVESEDTTMFQAREIASDLNLEMKINDVEYQGDSTKVVFYYTADERVDFRELIKIFAEKFKVRIEMRQIGVRQEASRLGGIGSCGRELCCTTWLTNFISVTTNTARTQQLSLNPQKLAGQCGKLKCCLNFEHDVYLDALKNFPNNEIVLKTKKGEAIYHKSDIFKNIMWYSYIEDTFNLHAIPVDKVKKIIELNAKGEFPAQLEDFVEVSEQKIDFKNGAGQDDLTRFDN
ncbi:MAG: hypothetical protein K8R58_04840 [Bacteroidales bacterium]|nr:hypothetical protein [Bacteroidales bacterium]